MNARVQRWANVLLLCAACSSWLGAAQAQSSESEGDEASTEAPGRFATVFVYGSSAGSPTTGKWFTLASLYTLSAGSLALAGVQLAEYMQQRTATRDFLKEHAGPCFDLSSNVCESYTKLIRDEHKSSTYASASLAAFGVLLLSGVVTAQVWDNEPSEAEPSAARIRPQVSVSLDATYVGVSGSF